MSFKPLEIFDYTQYKRAAEPPPLDTAVETASPTAARNHTHAFRIHDAALWCRRFGKRKWKRIPYPFSAEPLGLDAGGANLAVLDVEGVIHFKRVLREKVEEGRYCAFDKTLKANWKTSWFALPYVRCIVNFFTGRELRLKTEEFALSHRGLYNAYHEDAAGKRHYFKRKGSVTTLGAMGPERTKYLKYDRFSPLWARIEVPFPQTPQKLFIAESFQMDASLVMTVGYEVDRKTAVGKLKILTKQSDYDIEGWNPALKYRFFDNGGDPSVRVLPIQPCWSEQPLPEGEVTKGVTVLQFGEGSEGIELRIDGKKGERWGYFKKRLTEERWEFVEAPVELKATLTQKRRFNSLPPSRVKNLTGEIACLGKSFQNVQFRNFGEASNLTAINFEHEGAAHELQLYRRYSLWSFLAIERRRYDLLIPEASRPLFGGRLSYKVQVVEKGGRLSITDVGVLDRIMKLFKWLLIKKLLGPILQDSA